MKNFKAKLIGRKFVRDVGVLTIANFVGALLSFAQGILVARWLGPELYGVTALVMSYPGLVYTFFDAYSSQASVKYLSEFHAQGEQQRALAMCKLGYVIDLAIAFLAFGTVLISANWAAREVAHQPEAVGLIIVYALAFIPRGLVGTSRAILSTLGKFYLMAWIEFLTTGLRVILVLCLVLGGWQVSGVVWGNAIAMVATGLVYGFIGQIETRRSWGSILSQGKWQVLKPQRGEIFRFLGYNNLSTLLGMLPKQMDVLLIGYFRNPLEVGYYSLAKKLVSMVSYMAGPLQSVTYPEISRLWGLGGKHALRQKVQRLALQVGLPLGLAVSATVVLVPFFLPLLLGEDYRPAIAATQLLLIGSATWLACFWLRPLYFTIDQIKTWSLGIGIYAFVFVVLSIPVTVNYGYVGMSVLQSLGLTVFQIFMAIQLIVSRLGVLKSATDDSR
ncbi:oligosaccharide flippase family protein [Lyngbya aestuarii]|uniref:oligosaccharide flippase family protein n=1 Tax=Lyngbya aestuarii TaxID=118322 RepID=UPI00403D8712